MSKISLADYEPRRSSRQTSRPVRYVIDDDDDEASEAHVRPSSGKRRRTIVETSDDDDRDSESSDIGMDTEESDLNENMDDSSDDVKVRKRNAPVTRPSRRRVSYADSSDEEDDEEEDAEEASDEDPDDEDDGEDNESVRQQRRPSRVDDIESLFEESDEPSIEKIISLKVDANGVKLYEVKWKGRSYIHNSWHTESELMDFKGFRILVNFIKQEKANKEVLQHISDEQREQMNVAQEMALQKRQAYMIPERILTTRIGSDGITNEYLVKWTDLPYDCCTWEKAEVLESNQLLIDSYLERTRSSGRSFAKSQANSKGFFRKFETQPEWMASSGCLRDYQLEGLNWLRFSHFEKRNVILADEMGLGKTIQCISFLGSLHADLGIPGPYLVVVPLSTISAWKREFAKWTPWMNVIEYRGNVQARAVCRKFEWGSGKQPLFNVLLINYEVANKDFQYLSQYTWSYLLVDEAHRLKDDQSLLYQTLKSLRSSHRLLITGTPLQNSVKELWCLLHFLDPHKFKDLIEFQSLYGEIAENTASVRGLSRLHDLLKPYLLRRTKSDVLKSLPSKTERILRIDMSEMQKRYYRWVLTKNFHELNKGLKGGSMSSLSNTIVELKKVANHPYLFDNAELSHHENVQQELTRMVSNSGKLVLLDRLLDRLFETGHRVLIFSQMVRMLDILADYMVLKGFKFQRLDGGMSSEDRQHAMDHFNADGSSDFVFLLSTRAGGLGVNLATADTVIIFDSDWNPQNDLQAEARAHRIGQTKTVNIYRFVTKGTVEEDILERAKRKMILDHLVIQKMDTSGRGALSNHKQGNKAQFDKAELMRIVEFGAKQLFDESEDTNLGDNPNSTAAAAAAAAAFDLDEILARAETSTDRDQVDQTDEFLSAFKFADFVSSAPNQEVIVKTNVPAVSNEDASFWEKVIPAHLRPAKNCDLPDSAELIYPRRARMGKAFAEPEDEEVRPNTKTVRNSGRKKGSKSESNQKSPSKVKSDASREVKLAVKALMQFGDEDRTVSMIPGDENKNRLLVRRIVDECNSEKDIVAIDGIEIDAAALKARIEDMAILKKRVEAVDAPYERFRVTAQIQSVRWKCNWGVRHDSMLLLGTYLYGVGAWNEILADSRLGISEVVVKPNSDERIVGNSQLSSRLQALLRAIRSQEHKLRSNVSQSLKRKSSDTNPSSKRSAKARAPSSPSKEAHVDDPKISNWCLATMKESKPIVKALKKLKSIHREAGLSSDPKAVVKYIFKVGDFITRTGNENKCSFASPEQVEHHLWTLSAPFVRSKAGRLAALYWDLAAEPNATSKQESILRRFDDETRNR